MKVKELIPILPKYSDNSGYDVKINYIHSISIFERRREIVKNCHYDSLVFDFAEEKFKNIMECEIEKITAGKCLVGGDFDDSLQIWLNTEEFARIEDHTKSVNQ